MASLKNSESPLVVAARRLLADHLPRGRRVCVALSGGMDSTTLLHVMHALRDRWQVSACHVNHGISARAGEWEAFCRRMCDSLAVPLTVHREKPSGEVTEAWARGVRLRAFNRCAAEVIVAAHHAGDQAETVLFRLLRGAGVHGLAAMRPHSPLSGKIILRPWLDISRRVIADYAHQHRLCWVEDEDNQNLSRRRNFLRWRGLRVLAEEFPSGEAALAAAGRRQQEGSALLLQLAEIDDAEARQADGGYAADYFRRLGEARTQNWLYAVLSRRRRRFSERHLTEAARQIVHCAGQHTGLCFDFQGLFLRMWRGGLYWDSFPGATPSAVDFNIDATAAMLALEGLGGRLILSEKIGGGLSPAKIGASLSVRSRRGGEILKPPGRAVRTVAELLQEASVFPWRRRRWPLIFANERLAAVPGIAVSSEFVAAENETGLDCRFEAF